MEAEVHRTGSVVLYAVTFQTGTATFQSGSEAALRELLELLNDRTDWRFEVQGHAGDLVLSEQRARAVVEWLTTRGIAASRLVAKGYGDTMPLLDNTSDEERAKNERVELKKLHEE